MFENQSNYRNMFMEPVKEQTFAPTFDLLKNLTLPHQKEKLNNENMSSGGSTHCDSDSDSFSSSTPTKSQKIQKQQRIQQQQLQQNIQQQQNQKKQLSHQELQQLQQQQNYKTEICRNWRQNGGVCQYGKKCRYAHGEEDLNRKSNVNEYFKTRECKLFHQEGYCSYGIRCHFIHVNKNLEDVKRESKLTREACLEKGIIFKTEKSRFDFAQDKKEEQEEVQQQQKGILDQLQLPKIQQQQGKKLQTNKMKEAFLSQQQQQNQCQINNNQLQYLQQLNQTNNVNYQQQYQSNQQFTCLA